MFVKICGLTTPEDAVAAADAGADALGLNFCAFSRRQITVDQAREIVAAVPAHVLLVGVFRDHLAREVIDIVEQTGVHAAQLHGAESPATSRQVHGAVPTLIRALAAGDPQLADIDGHGADVVLLDAPTPGSGHPFDWALVGDLTARHRVLLAGGLRPENVAEAIGAVGPWGVDTASGVESSPGRKDPDAMRRFVNAAKAADSASSVVHPPLAAASHDWNSA